MNIREFWNEYKKPIKKYAAKVVLPIILDFFKNAIKRAKNKPESTKKNELTSDTPTPIETPKTINFDASPNYSSRKGAPIDAIILHHTGPGGLQATVSWFKKLESGVSAHYVVDRDGSILQMVKDEDKAWHCGESILEGQKNVNVFSIGIEIVGDGAQEFTKEQYESVAWLCKTLKKKYNIVDRRIVGHKDIAPGRKIDPYPFDWEKFKQLLVE